MARASGIEIEILTRESCILTLRGEHDAATRGDVSLVLALVRDYTYVLVDLTPCSFIDATVINTLVANAIRIRAADGALELIAPEQATGVRRTLGLAGVLPLLPLHATRSDGLAAIATAERLRPHSGPVSLRAVRAEIDYMKGKAAASRAIHAAKIRGLTVVRAQVEESAIESLDETRRRRAA